MSETNPFTLSDETQIESAERALAVTVVRSLSSQIRQLRDLLTRVKNESELRMNSLRSQLRRVETKYKRAHDELVKLRASDKSDHHQHFLADDSTSSPAYNC